MARKARPVVLVDADSIVYRVGFATQKRIIQDVIEDDSGKFMPMQFEGRAERKKYLKDNPTHSSVADPIEEFVVEPVSHALQTVKHTLERLAQLGTPVIYLSGKGNYRDKIATIVPYKGNRDPSDRPVHYDAIRGYLADFHGAILVDGCEADDAVSIRAEELFNDFKSFVVASIDKDLDQVAGRHFDFVKDVEYSVDEDEALRWFWVQCLSGDPGDNVPGCWKVGPAKAEKIIDECEALGEWQEIVEQYRASQTKANCPYGDKDFEKVAIETAQLVYIQKKAGELWQPPGTPFGRVEGDNDD